MELHGELKLGWNLSKEDVWQRLRIFDAIYFPDEEKRTELLLR